MNNFFFFELGKDGNIGHSVSQKEAAEKACLMILPFCDSQTDPFERVRYLTTGGCYTALIKDNEKKDYITRLFRRCSELEDNESLILSENEKLFLRVNIESRG